MTRSQTLFGIESLPQQNKTSLAPEYRTVVAGTDGTERVFIPKQSEKPTVEEVCIIYTIRTEAKEFAHIEPDCEGFDQFIQELESRPEDAARLAEANKWVARKFYSGEPTLASLRLAAGLSQRALAYATGLEQSHISRYESGRVVPGTDIGSKLARALGVSLDDFERARATSASARVCESE